MNIVEGSRSSRKYDIIYMYENFNSEAIMRIKRKDSDYFIDVFIDSEDIDMLKNIAWYPHRDKNKPLNLVYIYGHRCGKFLKLHRFILNYHGSNPVDHINRNTLDNRKENLRICTVAENNRNISIRRNNTSGYIGVNYSKLRSKWRYQLTYKGKIYSKCNFNSKEEAKVARDELLNKLVFND